MADLTATWAAELGRYEAEDLRSALEAMRLTYKDFPPTLFQFSDLCRDAKRRRETLVMSLPNKVRNPIPERIKLELDAFVGKHTFGGRK